MTDFGSLGIGAALQQRLQSQGIAAPVKAQVNAIPEIMRGRDVILNSATGTGKTLAYVLPLLQRLEERAAEAPRAPQGLVIAPTQELAMQILRVIEGLAGKVKTAACIGGASLQRQIERLKEKPALVVGTAGRLLELHKLRKLKLHLIECVVIDEVDQLLALGGGEDLEVLLGAMPRDRQLLFVTATVTGEVRRKAAMWMRDPVEVEGETMQEAAAAIRHQFMLCERRDKIDLARRLIRTLHPEAALIFASDADKIVETEAKLAYTGLPVMSLYGEAGKRERADVMRRFAAGQLRLLIATDIAARGLDVPGITHIINIDPPPDAERYVHRAGRTGRMGRGGTVITLATPAELPALRKAASKLGLALEAMTLSRGQWVAAPETRGKAAGRGGAGGAHPGKAPARSSPSRGKAPLAGKGAPVGPGDSAAPARTPQAGKGDDRRPASPKVRHKDRKNKGAPRWLKSKQ